jgi:hypothetical protein
MFPSGWPGLALLLLRASVAIALLLDGYAHSQQLSIWVEGAAIVVAVAVAIGYLTPILAAIGLLFHGLMWSSLGVHSVGVAFIICVDALALALLGPGAYSVDSYRFGRRVVVLPPTP